MDTINPEARTRNGATNGTENREPGGIEAYSREELVAMIDLLEYENRQLRRHVTDARRHQYRGVAGGLLVVGIACGLLGFTTSEGTDVLFALAGIGIFGSVFTYYLTPDRFISADIGNQVYAATAQSYEQICADLGLSDRRVYVPLNEHFEADKREEVEELPEWQSDVRLFIPQKANSEPPQPEVLRNSAFIVSPKTETNGLSITPTGEGLFYAFMTSLNEPLGDDPRTLHRQLSEAMVEDFELVRSTNVDIDPQDGRMSVRFSETLYDYRSRFDHPVVSFFAVGLGVGLGRPIDTRITNTDPLTATFRWESESTPEA